MEQMDFLYARELAVDLFAGGGGMSFAMKMAFGREPDIAINHNEEAISMHRANHPGTRHFVSDVFEVDPRGATQGRPVGWLHLSPDCTHHSQARGGQPRDRKIRGLSWVGKRWGGQAHPRVITLENVRQILQWGPLIAKRDKATGRVITLDMVQDPETGRMVNRIASPGERVPLEKQFLIPNPRRAGETWKKFVRSLEAMGYRVEWRLLNAADFGAGTRRTRLFMVARRDGRPIVWPEPTHHQHPKGRQQPWRRAADSIDWAIPCPSIFERKKPLADATLRRITLGIRRYVLESADPFIVPIAHYNGRDAAQSAAEPLRTITAATKGGEFALCAPSLLPATHQGAPRAYDPLDPLPTITAAHRGELMAASAYLMQANGGFNETPGHDARDPMSTITNTGSQQQLVTAHLATLRRHGVGVELDQPVPTLTAGGEHHALVAATLVTNTTGHNATDLREPTPTLTTGQHHAVATAVLSPEVEAGALRVAAFLLRYHSTGGQWADPRDPMTTFTTADRLALVTVTIRGVPYVIVDIGLRMLTPRELYDAQGFPSNYIIEHGHDGRKFSKSAQVRMVGNSVSPPPAVALIRANLGVAKSATRRIAA